MKAPSKSPPDLTEGQWDIMKTVWQSQPCAAPAVQEALHPTRKWSYSTVRTMMDRMAAKGFLTTEKIRNLTLYRAALSNEQAQKSEVSSALKRAFNGALTPMVQCLLENNNLNADELAELEKLIREKRKNIKS